MFLRISIFVVLAYFLLVLLAVVQQASGLFSQDIGLPQWGPGLAALLMLVLFRKDNFKITFFAKETPFSRYLVAALIPFAASVVITLTSSLLSIERSIDAPAHGSLLAMALWVPFGALGEELGWRGYLHKKLDTRFRGLVSSLLVGLLWFPIHMSFFSRGPLFVLFLALLIVAYSVVIYALVQDTGFNVILATVFHTSIGLSNLLFLDIIYETQLMVVNASVWVIIAAWTVFSRRAIFFHPRPTT